MTSIPIPLPGDYVYVPVRVDRVDAVLRFLGELADPQRQVVAESDLERTVQRVYLESERQFRRLLELLADSPGRPISSTEIADGLELPNGPASLAGMLGAFARRAKNRYAGFWPFERLQNPADETTELMMDSNVATIVKGLAPASDSTIGG